MKFGLRLQREAIPEWRTQYIDYDSLKRLLKQIPYSEKTASLEPPTLEANRIIQGKQQAVSTVETFT